MNPAGPAEEPDHPSRSQRWGPWRLVPKKEPHRRLRVLALHGFGGSPAELRPLGQALRRDGFLCVAPLLPGHGENLEAMDEVDLSDWLEAVTLSYESLRTDDSPVVILGFCLGGALALDLAPILRPRALCLLSTPVAPFPESTFAPLGNRRSLHKSLNDSNSEKVRRWRSLASYSLVGESFFQQYQTLLRRLSSGLPKLDCPLLVAQSRHSQVTTSQQAEQIVRATQSPKAKLVWANRAGHALAIDVGRRALYSEILDFLEIQERQFTASFDQAR